jgi:sugar phosphate permease
LSSQPSRWASFQQVRRLPWIVLALVTIATVFNYVDRMVLAALAQPVKQEFSLTDTQLGLLTGFAFAAFYAVLVYRSPGWPMFVPAE